MLGLNRVEKYSLNMGAGQVGAIAFGKGDKPLVLIPGLSLQGVREAGASLAIAYRIFAKDYRVWVFDRKTPADKSCTIQSLADDLALAMATMGIEKACVLGVSMGGMIGQYLAIGYPQLVGKLALGVTASQADPLLAETVARWLQFAEAEDWRALAEDMFARMYSPGYLKKHKLLLPLAVRLAKPADPEQFKILAKACLTVDCYSGLSQIRCPAMVLGGKEDKVLGREASEKIAAKLHCPLWLYPGLGHSAYEEAPDFNKKVLDFFSGSS